MVEPKGLVGSFDGRQLHWREQDGQGPAVVLMAGCGLAMEYWRDLVQLLPDRRVIAYDRPGMGGTRWPGHLPRLAEEVESLAGLLDHLQVQGAVLVAHSMASFHAEALARLRPDLVSGVVMVDGSVEWYARPPRVMGTWLPRGVRWLGGAGPIGSAGSLAWRLGTWLQSGWSFGHLGYGGLPDIYSDPQALAMATAESLAYQHQAWDLQQLRPGHAWPAVPVVVLSAGTRASWIRTSRRYAQLLGGRHVVVDDCKHLMMLDRPDVIADAVRSVS